MHYWIHLGKTFSLYVQIFSPMTRAGRPYRGQLSPVVSNFVFQNIEFVSKHLICITLIRNKGQKGKCDTKWSIAISHFCMPLYMTHKVSYGIPIEEKQFFFLKLVVKLMDHPPYVCDLILFDFRLFPTLKINMCIVRFSISKEAIMVYKTVLWSFISSGDCFLYHLFSWNSSSVFHSYLSYSTSLQNQT